MEITYLLGAGASALAIPTVKEFEKELKDFSDDLQGRMQWTGSISGMNNLEFGKWKEKLLAGLRDLGEKTKEFGSPDNYAKCLFLQNSPQLRSVKALMSIFISLKRLKYKVDPRYHAFFANIVDSDINSFPPNVKIVNWNYDTQFEDAYKTFAKSNDCPLVIYKQTPFYSRLDRNKFAAFKLNGSSKVVRMHKYLEELINTSIQGGEEAIHFQILQRYADMVEGMSIESGISFAWEGSPFIDYVKNDVSSTEILIIIGYSFPFFNRKIDKTIIGAMKGLQKIFIQDTHFDSVAARLTSVRDFDHEKILVDRVNDVGQFYIPSDL